MLKQIFIVILLLNQIQSIGQHLQWAKNFGDSSYIESHVIITDSIGNIYHSGYFVGEVDFDPGPNVFHLSGVGDIFISKFDPNGAFLWAKRMGGSATDLIISMTVDRYGNLYSTGIFSGTSDFDPGPGTFTLTQVGGLWDMFVSKLDASGNFVWAKSIGGFSEDSGQSIALDAGGNTYITGQFNGVVDFNPGPGTYTLSGYVDSFILKLNSSGDFVWAKSLLGNGSEAGYCISIDGFRNVFLEGTFYSTVDFDPGPGTYTVSASTKNIYILKLDSSGNFKWVKNFNSTNDIAVTSMEIDASGNIHTLGFFDGTADFDPGVGNYSLVSTGYFDAYITKLDSLGNFIWAKSMGGLEDDRGSSISLDSHGNVYTTGYFNNSVDFDPGPGTFFLNSSGGGDIFVSKLNFNGDFIWAQRFGEKSYDRGASITNDLYGNTFVVGDFTGIVDFDFSSNVFNLSSDTTSSDAFLIKLGPYSTTDISIISSSTNSVLNIYPNPNDGDFNLRSTVRVELTLVNTIGQCLMNISLSPDNNFQTIIKGFSSGVYFLTGQDKSQSIKHKIIVVK